MGRFLLPLLVWACLPPQSADASDFWDEVRNPGARAYYRSLRAGHQALRSGRAVRALQFANEAIGRLPSRPEGHVTQARAHAELGHQEPAVESYRVALGLDPAALDDPSDGGPAAHTLARAGELELAADLLNRLVSRMPANALRRRLYALRGDVLQSLGPSRLHEAVLSYRAALRSQGPAELPIRLGLALAMDRRGEPQEARRMVASLSRRGRLEHGLARLPIPISERAARRALGLSALGDSRGAQEAWKVVASMAGPWREHAVSALGRVTPTTAP